MNQKPKSKILVFGGGFVAFFVVLMLIDAIMGNGPKNSENAYRPPDIPPNDPSAAAVVTGVTIAPFTTAQGQPGHIVQSTIRNTGTKPIYSVFADLTLYDANGTAFDVVKGQCIYTTYSGQSPLASGATYSQADDRQKDVGWLSTPADGGDVVKATATITKIETRPALD